ncbi:CRISPR-associated helicase Cas3' [Enterococcus sp. LJL120]
MLFSQFNGGPIEKIFLAKSDGETIIEHTENLLGELARLKSYYPSIPVDWELLKMACQYHDLGKINHLFQEKLEDSSKRKENEIPHALLSISLLPIKALRRSLDDADLETLVYAIALHHERDFSEVRENPENYQEQIKLLTNSLADFDFEKLQLTPPVEAKQVSKFIYKVDSRLGTKDKAFHQYVMLKGLLNRIDYAASGHYQVEYPPGFLENNMDKVVAQWRTKTPQADWNPMQRFTFEHQEESLLIIGQTGLGKTEAGLRWIGGGKGFFTLPLKVADNAVFERVEEIADENRVQEEVGLLHSDSLAFLLDREDGTPEELDNLEKYLSETQSWSLPLTVTTLDQTFDFVYHYRGFELKLATLAYSKIVIDEIQMYSPDLLAYLIRGLKEIQDYGGRFLIMTATMPEYLVDLFNSQGLKFTRPAAPFLDENCLERHRLELTEKQLEAADVAELYQGDKLLVICNTVKKAKQLYQELQKQKLAVPIKLLHSQFTRADRKTKEQEILNFTKDNFDPGIWIATQVVEASLDIDFDMLITELSELNGLFQRMGRCYRKRPLGNLKTANIHIFIGGKKEVTSGVSKSDQAVVHKDIFELARKALLEQGNGVLNEQQKLAMIAETYTTQTMQSLEYYQNIKKMMSWLAATENDAPSKEKVKQLFRNINTRNVIPCDVYKEKKNEIDSCIEKLLLKNNDITPG